MIRQYQKEEQIAFSQNSPERRNNNRRRKTKRHTVRFDSELMDQIAFLSNNLEIKKIEIIRQLVKQKIQNLNLWEQYQNSPTKKFNQLVAEEKKKQK
jgi:hypothetical protein